MTLANAASRALQSALEKAQVRSALESEADATEATDIATVDGSSTTSDGGGDDASMEPTVTEQRASKKRRSTHQVRKEEKQALLDQIALLQERLEELEEEKTTEKLELHRAVVKKANLTASVEVNHMALAGTQSMLSSYTSAGWQSPLSTYIHLTADQLQRTKCLEDVFDRKLDVTMKFMLERTRFLDLRREQAHTESCELENGDFVFTRFDVTPFGREHSSKRVFEEMIQYLSHQEISISEDLGILTIVDAEDVLTPAVRHNRLVSVLGDGLEVESNAVLFQKYVHAGADSYGIGCIDYVDQDDLFSSDPAVRLRKDLTAGGFVAACPSDSSDAPPVVSLSRWTSVRLCKPGFPITKNQEIVVRESMRVWGSIMIKVMQERLGLR